MPATARALPALLLAFACATTSPPAAPQPAAAGSPLVSKERAVNDEEIAPAPEVRLEKRAPPARRSREYLVKERSYEQLAKNYPLGFSPDDCEALCRQRGARTPSDDPKWVWVLRCFLRRNLHDEPVVACREDAEKPERVPLPKASRLAGIDF